MSWLPGITSNGRPRARRNSAARSCSRRRPRCARSPVTTINCGSMRSINGARPRSISVSSTLPACKSERWRSRICNAEAGYTLSSMADEATEIFDDLYLGLRAGGALRKQRRGEPLTTEEQEALGRWQRLSTWRKGIAIGGFAVGTFGLGFTLGGLIFGRWRKAKA